MRIDPNGTIGGHPTLFVRKLMQRLGDRMSWDMAAVQKIAAVNPPEARALIKTLNGEGLVERDRGTKGSTWNITNVVGHSVQRQRPNRSLGRRPREPWRSS